MDNSFPLHLSSKSERTSAFTSKGSLSIEAALVVPFFFLGLLCLAYYFEIMILRMNIQEALYSSGREMAQESYFSPILSTANLKQRMVQHIGKERLNDSILKGGTGGLTCYKTQINEQTAVLQLTVEYRVQIPFPLFDLLEITYRETLRLKGWTGYNSESDHEDETEVVYVTENGAVYHKEKTCTYLDVRVIGISATDISEKRNASGGKYYACELCGEGSHFGILYVSEYGTRYHTTLSCNKIKRNVYAVSIADVKGREGCSKCVQSQME